MGYVRQVLGFIPGVRPWSSVERAAMEQAALAREQNRLLAQIVQQESAPAPVTGPSPDAPPLVATPGLPTCCLECVNRGCGKQLGGQVNWTRVASHCDCREHHPR